MSLPSLQLSEPLVSAMVTLLKENLNTTIDQLNTTITDDFLIQEVAQIVPYVPVPSTLQGGMPCVGVQRLGATFVDDLQYRLDAEHTYAVVAILQNSDQQSLAWQLDRTAQAIANTIQADRLAGTPPGTTSIMKVQGGAWSVEFVNTTPGPLLGDLDPLNPEAPPRSYLSWTAITFKSKRGEVF